MSYILVVDDDEDICDVLAMILESHFDNEIKQANSGNLAIELLKNDSDALAVLTDYRMFDGTGGDLYSYIREELPGLPVCLISTYRAKDLDEFKNLFDDHPLNDALVKPFRPDDVVDFVEKVLTTISDEPTEPIQIKPKYLKVSIKKFLDNPVDSDVYLKLSESKFVKIRNGSDDDGYDNVSKYIDKEVHEIYLTASDYNLFAQNKIDELSKNVAGLDKSSNEIITDINSVEQIHDTLLSMGVNEKTLFLVDKSIEATLHLVEEDEFSSVLKKLDQLNSYLYSQAYLTAYISRLISSYISWSSYYTKEEDLNVAYVVASLFQNISLVDDPRLAEVFREDHPLMKNLSPQGKGRIKEHPLNSLNEVNILTSKYKHIGNLIVNHHEQPNKKGFPSGIGSSEIELHEAVFIIAANFSHDMLKTNMTKSDLKLVAQGYNEVYGSEEPFSIAYKSFLKAFNQIF